MDLKQLGYFLQVAESGSFSRASMLLGVAQPALSRQVRQLEAELGQDLFVRDGRGVRLTEAGSRLIGHAADVLRRVNVARNEIDELRGSPAGHITVGMPTTITKLTIVPLVREFRARFPRANLKIVDGLSSHLKEFLAAGRIDIAILFDVQPSPAFDVFPFLRDPLHLISARSVSRRQAPVALQELWKYPLIMQARPNPTRMRIEEELARFGKRPEIAMEIDAIAPTLELVAAGFGSTLLSPNAIRAWAPSADLVARQVVPPVIAIETSIVTSTRGPMSTLQSATLELIREIAGPLLALPRGRSQRALPGRRGRKTG